jgi:type I restriction enzyme S subunit
MIENLKPYPEYKDSGLPWLGEVPAHWEIARGRQLFEIRKRIAGTLGYPLLSITQQGLRVKDVSRGEGQFSQDYSKYQLVKPGEFAMNAMDLITGGVGIAAHEGVTSPDYRVFAIRNEEQHRSRFYLLLFRMLYANLAFYSCGQGSAQLGRWRLPRKRFNDFFFPTPPVSEQTAIARVLAWATNHLDRAIGAKRRIIALLQEQKQAIIHRAVTRGLDPSVPLKDSGIPWLGEIPEHWEIARIKTEFECLNSRRIPLSTTERGKMKLRQYDYYGASSIIDKVDEYLFDDDLILIAEDGANLVNRNLPLAIIARGKYWVNNHAHILKPRKGRLEYLAALLECMDYRPWISGAAQPKLTQDRLMSIRIAHPPPEEQSRIAEQFKNEAAPLELSIRELHQEVNLLREYRTRLIADVVTGKLDVREVAAGLPEEELQDQSDVDAVYDADEAEDDAQSDLIDTAED